MEPEDGQELKAVLLARRRGKYTNDVKSKESEEKKKSQREAEEKELQELKEKQEKRKKERQEREVKLTEQQQPEMEGKQKAKEVHEQKEAAETAKKVAENEQHEAAATTTEEEKPNYVIKRGPKPEMNGSVSHKLQSQEEHAAEKEKVLAERCGVLDVEGFNNEELKIKANELFTRIQTLLGQTYGLEERSKQQEGELADLSERSRQTNKGDDMHTGARIEVRRLPANYKKPDYQKISERSTQAPPPVALTSKFERKTDRRSFAEKLKVFERR